MKRRYLYFIFAVSVFMLFNITGCGKKRSKIEGRVIPVEAQKVERGNISLKLFYVGDIKAKFQVKVYPKAPGKLIENIVEEQDEVKKGEILAYIDRDEVGFEFEKMPVESPIDGIVGNIYLDKGEGVSQEKAVAEIVDMDTVKIRIDAVERDLPKIKEGQIVEAKIDAYPDIVFNGTVDRISPVVDLASRTAPVEIEIPNKDHMLKAGMFARLNILIDEKKDVLIIPRDAIIKENSSNYVFTVKDNIVQRQKVELGSHEDNKFEVVKGAEENDVVVTLGNARLKDGDTVKITNEKEAK